MRTFGPLLRVAVLCGLVAVLWIKPKAVRAQAGGCIDFTQMEICCPSCCSSRPCMDEIESVDGTGYDTLQEEDLDCGSPGTCMGQSCGTGQIPVAVENGECFCGTEGSSCGGDEDCCLGEYCDDGRCEDTP